jgi:ABC-type transport system involved in multi-copper enzyme maturation permease subunit
MSVPTMSFAAGQKSGRLTWHGIRTMAGLEFRLRIRAGRWRWLLVAWFLLLAGFTTLLRLALERSESDQVGVMQSGGEAFVQEAVAVARPLGTPMFGGLMLFLLGLALLIVPALTAQSVNGDRDRGVLAPLQTTLLSPAEIALGKLLAAWTTSLVFLAAAVPLVVWSMAEGGVEIIRAIVAMAVVVLLVGVVCAVALCISSMLCRGTTSAVLSYLFVFALTILTPITFGLALTATTTTRTITQHATPAEPSRDLTPQPQTLISEESVADPSKVWWLLAPNPFVILADAAPRAQRRCDPRTDHAISDPLDPLAELGNSARQARLSVDQTADFGRCEGDGDVLADQTPPGKKVGPVWPYGLAFDLLIGLGAVALTIRRLRTPTRKLPTGVRVA